jgi:hypothetical protein
MTKFLLLFFASFSFAQAAPMSLTRAQEKELEEKIKIWWQQETRFTESLKKGEVISWANVVGEDKQQTMTLKVLGLHPRSCGRGLRKISRYEDYPKHMSFVKTAGYNENTKRVRFQLDHAVLPYPMVLYFEIPRITKPGRIPFMFHDGIFTGFKGTIEVAPVGNRCVYFLRGDWTGKSTGMPNLVVETFAQTIIKMGLEHLIRISSL